MHVQVTVGVSGDAGERMPIHSALTRGFATVDEAFAVAATVAHPADASSTRGVAHPEPVILPDVPAGTSGLPMVPPAAVDSGGDRPDAPAGTPPATPRRTARRARQPSPRRATGRRRRPSPDCAGTRPGQGPTRPWP